MRRVPACLLALALGAVCALLVACGGGGGHGLIGQDDADAMLQQLDQIESSVRRGACEGLTGELTGLQEQVNGLPRRVDAALQRRLQEGVANLARISPDRCAIQAAKTQTAPVTVETTPTTPTQTTPTTPTQTTPTTPTQTTPTQTIPPATTPTPPPAEPPATTTGPDSGGAAAPADGDTGGGAPTP